MEDRENLSEFSSAYHSDFKFFQENQWYLKRYVDRIAEFVRANDVRSMLSLGIGHQVVSSRLLSLLGTGALKRYTVIEGSEEILDGFRNQTPKVDGLTLVQDYFERFDTDERFDAIEMGFVLEHVENPGLIVERFSKFLSPGGRLFVAVPNARSLHRLIGHHAGLLEDVYQLSEYDRQLGHRRYFDLRSVTSLIETAGLDVVRQQGLMLKPITADQMSALDWGGEII
jgi:SAM-dependent methyltransferase